jgi:hypothetical protein
MTYTQNDDKITAEQLAKIREEFEPLVGLRITWLALPGIALSGFEPSQVAVIVNTLLDAALPQIKLLASSPENSERLNSIGLEKAPRSVGERESYPDYIHKAGYRFELKGLFVDNPELGLKRPPTRREPSARIKDNVTIADVNPAKDILLMAAVQLRLFEQYCHPIIIDIGLFPMIDCIKARDERMLRLGGRWNGKVPQCVKKSSIGKFLRGESLIDEDYQHDTNFGKMKRIPYLPLQLFLKKHGVSVNIVSAEREVETLKEAVARANNSSRKRGSTKQIREVQEIFDLDPSEADSLEEDE